MPYWRQSRVRFRKPELWERNLVVLWFAQAISAMGFSFFFPFVPLFIQELGVDDPGQAALWSGIAGGAGGVFMMISGPIWGILGDRYGRKKNVLRALFGSALVLSLTAVATDVHQLVAFRVLLGLVSGTWVTIMALGSAMAPRHKVTFSIGVVQSASFLGFTLGPLVGGFLADGFGFRASFLITGLLVTFSGLLVLLLVKEVFEKPETQEKLGVHLVFKNFAQVFESRSLRAILLVLMLVQIGPTMMMPVMPVFIGTLLTSGTAATSAGIAFSLMGLTATFSSLLMTRLTRRVGLNAVLIGAFVGGSLIYIPLYFATTITQVYVLIAALGLFNGGLNTLTFGLVGTAVPKDKQGAAYGTAQSASALAWGAGPLAGGIIAGGVGLREVFLVNSGVLLVTAFLATKLLKGAEQNQEKVVVSNTPATSTAD